ncbi:LCP family protein [Granulicoccus phenolivorans]|uniref:LCP family protein n=1 Tax=Granulicoccus phenolivorans TaxID=266854 RepID=UPI001FDEFFE1|nr:LCP family protein [Granulicoccus phenolivorans]
MFAVIVLSTVITWFANPGALVAIGFNLTYLRILMVALPVVGLAWVALIVATYLDLKPRHLTNPGRALGAVLVGVLCLTIAAPMAVGGRYAFDQARVLERVFGNSDTATQANLDARDPWKTKPRVNILLLGGDAGSDRTGTRTDSLMVASVDTKTGDTVLIGLPRNTARIPFPENSPLHKYYPNGFYNGNADDQEYFVNSIYDNVPQSVPADILGPTSNLGADALKLGVGEALGIPIDYYLLIELDAFPRVINALGGITVNINTWVAKGGQTDAGIPPDGWLRPGPNQHLNGWDALWFARGRYGADDFQRMDRQRCVIQAAVSQANVANLLSRYEDIARQTVGTILTDIPHDMLPAFADLSTRIQKGKTRSIVFKHGVDGFYSPNPNYAMVRERVAQAISDTAAGKPGATPTPEAAPSWRPTRPSAAATPSATGASNRTAADTMDEGAASWAPTPQPGATSTAPAADDLKAVCAYKPEEAAQALANPPAGAR